MSERKWEEVTPEQTINDLKEIHANMETQRRRAEASCYDTIQKIISQHNMSYMDCIDILNIAGTLCDLLSPSGAKQVLSGIVLLYTRKG